MKINIKKGFVIVTDKMDLIKVVEGKIWDQGINIIIKTEIISIETITIEEITIDMNNLNNNNFSRDQETSKMKTVKNNLIT